MRDIYKKVNEGFLHSFLTLATVGCAFILSTPSYSGVRWLGADRIKDRGGHQHVTEREERELKHERDVGRF
jgi:hypothetical protein